MVSNTICDRRNPTNETKRRTLQKLERCLSRKLHAVRIYCLCSGLLEIRGHHAEISVYWDFWFDDSWEIADKKIERIRIEMYWKIASIRLRCTLPVYKRKISINLFLTHTYCVSQSKQKRRAGGVEKARHHIFLRSFPTTSL